MAPPRFGRPGPGNLQTRQLQKQIAYGMLYGSIFIFAWQLLLPGSPWPALIILMLLASAGLYFYHLLNNNQPLAWPPGLACLFFIGTWLLLKLHVWVLEMPAEELSAFLETARSLTNFERLTTVLMLYVIIVIALLVQESRRYQDGQIYEPQANISNTPDRY